MIYCVRFAEIEDWLRDSGWFRVRAFENYLVYRRGNEFLTIRTPNADGNLPEMLVNEAFDEKGIAPPELDTFWCD